MVRKDVMAVADWAAFQTEFTGCWVLDASAAVDAAAHDASAPYRQRTLWFFGFCF